VEPNREFNHGACAGCHVLGVTADAADFASEIFQPTQPDLRNCLQNARKVCADADNGRVWWSAEQNLSLGLFSGHEGGDEVRDGTALIDLARRWRYAGHAQ
jgi:hypothetical protein